MRAGMVKHPSDYPWSSYGCNANGQVDPIISPHELHLQLGESDDARQRRYRALFDAQLEMRELDEIRHATNKSWVLGSDRFKEQIESLTARHSRNQEVATGNQNTIVTTGHNSCTA